MSDVATIDVLRVKREDESCKEKGLDVTVAHGVTFPNGFTYAIWRRPAYPEHQRIDGPHVSLYTSQDGLRQATKHKVETIQSVQVPEE